MLLLLFVLLRRSLLRLLSEGALRLQVVPVLGALLLVHHGDVFVQGHVRANRKHLVARQVAGDDGVVFELLLQSLVVPVFLLAGILDGRSSVFDLLALHRDAPLSVLVRFVLGHNINYNKIN